MDGALAIDYAGPAWLTRERLRSLQRVAVAHFAERYSLFVIICLGESIVAVGVAAASPSHHLDATVVEIVALGLLITAPCGGPTSISSRIWRSSGCATHRDPVIAAADSYSYLIS